MSASKSHDESAAAIVNAATASAAAREPLEGTGGGLGGGTLAGAGNPSGGPADLNSGDPIAARQKAPDLSHSSKDQIAHEAKALGSGDGSLADAAGLGSGAATAGPTGAESLAAGAGRGDVGSGTPADRGELGGGDPLGRP